MPDPTGELRFSVTLPGLEIGRFSDCGGLSMEYEILEYQEGGQTGFVHKLRGQLKYPNLTLKRGMTHESALMEWFFQAQTADHRPTVTVSLLGPDAGEVRHWAFASAFPVKWQGPALNAGSTNIATETLEIAHAGLVRTS
jgi:phage tail-like protein